MRQKKIAIIGASYLQLPLIKKAKNMGIETHVFAWAANDVGEKEADFFYPISIIEKDQILNKCKEIGINGICSIASDLASITVNYVAQNMGLISNSLDCTRKATNKHLMRKCFEENNDPSPKSMLVNGGVDKIDISYPVIVKPVDRSGSRGITKVYNKEDLHSAIEIAKSESFDKNVLVEEYVEGIEYSVECISWKGKHQHLQTTLKYTTGSPNFIETGHIEPAPLTKIENERIEKVIYHALTSLGIEYGASHSEIKIDCNGNIKLIEIGGRMGGDFIGSNLVELSTGYDFVKNVILISLGIEPEKYSYNKKSNAAVRFIFDEQDRKEIDDIKNSPNISVIDSYVDNHITDIVKDSSSRHGYCLFVSKSIDDILNIMSHK